MRQFSISHLSGEAAALKFAILPFALMVVAHFIFSRLGFNLAEVLEGSRTYLCQTTDLELIFAETKARLLWATTVLVYLIVLVAVSSLSFRRVRKSLSPKGRILYVLVGLVFILFSLGHLLYSGYSRNPFSKIFYYTFEALKDCAIYDSRQLDTVNYFITGINIFSAIAPVLVLLAGCAIFAKERSDVDDTVDELKQKMLRLKLCIHGASGLMAAGIIHMLVWLRWPSLLLADSVLRQHSGELAVSLTIYWGATFSLVIASLYIPAAASLCKRAEAVLSLNPELCKGVEPGEWVQQQGLSLQPLQQIPQILAVFAPILAGPIGSSLTTITTTFS